ncbi:MAG: hypothetical protein JKY37_03075 [Nannocystaceae bacterium]|nr:hypothetical protein [Nannocystaceae bacterium]
MKKWVVVALLVAVAAGWWLSQSTENTAQRLAHVTRTAPGSSPRGSEHSSGEVSPPDSNAKVTKKRRVSKAERKAVRERIVSGIKAHREAAERTAAHAPPDTPEPGYKKGDIKDKSGGNLSGFIATINEDFMPLADECYQQALEADPALRGMLDVNFEILADEDVAGMVDAIELGEENEIHDAGMLECIRETMLSTIFPSPGHTGHDAVRLTLRFSPEEDPAE